MHIIDNTRPPRPRDGVGVRWLPDQIWEMMQSCWIPEPLSRVSIKEVHRVFLSSVTEADSPPPELEGSEWHCSIFGQPAADEQDRAAVS